VTESTDRVVLLPADVLAPLVNDGMAQYHRAWESSRDGARYLPRCWALLLGRFDEHAIRVDELRGAGNVRETDTLVLQEFNDVIVPCFGSAYANGRRGYWCDPNELLKISREAEEAGLEVLGSVHMHADVHRFWPEHAGAQRLSEHPTAMDEYLFRSGGWPLNMIFHLEGVGEDVSLSLGAWSPPPFDAQDAKATRLEVRLAMGTLAGVPG
jgi:hypothetical protein